MHLIHQDIIFFWSKHIVLSHKTENDNICLVFSSADFHIWKFGKRQTNIITAFSNHNIDKLCLWTYAYNTTHLRSMLWYRISCIIWAFLYYKNYVIFITCRLFKRLIIGSTWDHLYVCATVTRFFSDFLDRLLFVGRISRTSIVWWPDITPLLQRPQHWTHVQSISLRALLFTQLTITRAFHGMACGNTIWICNK